MNDAPEDPKLDDVHDPDKGAGIPEWRKTSRPDRIPHDPD